MDLLLWRCADIAKPDSPDDGDSLKTPLGERGRKQAERLARWLKEHQPKDLQVYSSPATATVQMAKLVSRAARIDRRLGPDAQPADLQAVVDWPLEHPAVLLIAHQPALGGLAALLLGGDGATCSIRKGALWWFTRRSRAGESQVVLRAVLSPELIGRAPPRR